MPKFLIHLIVTLSISSVSFLSFAQTNKRIINANAFTQSNTWVDSVMATLSPDQRIAQLFMVAAYSNRDTNHKVEIAKLVSEYGIGGLIFFQGGPVRQANLTNYYQSLSKIPLLISIDGEWGLAMRLDSTIRYPRQMPLGAITDNQLIYTMGAEIAKQAKRLGIHVNLAPVVDVNSNAKNPVINDRSFGEDKFNVAQKGIAYMRGMQDGGILANAKHFPGHGNTDQDSHYTLPVVNESLAELDSVQLYPFRELMNEGLSSMMIAHLFIPALDTTSNQASTLSTKIVNGFLKSEMNYKGLVFTDALNMKGVSDYYAPGQVDVMALLAGNDVLLFSEDVPVAIKEINNAIKAKKISMAEIDARVRKILLAKYLVGLDKYQPIETKNLIADLNNPAALAINNEITAATLTLVKNAEGIIPLDFTANNSIAVVNISTDETSIFRQTISAYANVTNFYIPKDADKTAFEFIKHSIAGYKTIIVAVHGMLRSPASNFGISKQVVAFAEELSDREGVLIILFGNAYSLANFPNNKNIVLAYEDTEQTRRLTAQAIFGALPFEGKLPVTASASYPINTGINNKNITALSYKIPEQVGLSSTILKEIDKLALEGIAIGAYPGCQILVAKDGAIIYEKSFGKLTYDGTKKVEQTDIYDIASITKVAATLLAVMKLYDDGIINLDLTIADYLPRTEKTNKANITIRQLLAHQAGLVPFIPFWKNAMADKSAFSTKQSNRFPIRVAEDVYIRRNYFAKNIWKEILESDVKDPATYVYSDLSFYFLKEIVEEITQQKLDDYLQTNFYTPLGLRNLGFNPRNRIDLDRIAPTEFDKNFRKQLVWGDVHDQGAAMMGGVAGHAGLFSNAGELAVIGQMMLNGGSYTGTQFLKPSTINYFNTKYFENNRRGLGFDKPNTMNPLNSPTAASAPEKTFGHTGFTGTGMWIDPDSGIVFVFLSNRIHPDAENRKLIENNIRTSIQEIIYKSKISNK